MGEIISTKGMDIDPEYPLVKARIIRKVDNDSLVNQRYKEGWKGLEYLEYCLANFSGTQNFQNRIDIFIAKYKQPKDSTNDQEGQLHNDIAEYEAAYLMHHSLGCKILGWDIPYNMLKQSKAISPPNCDLLIEKNGKRFRLEVKDNSFEESQDPPPALSKILSQIAEEKHKIEIDGHSKILWPGAVELGNKEIDLSRKGDLKKKMIEEIRRKAKIYRRRFRFGYSDKDFVVLFHLLGKHEVPSSYLEPVFIEPVSITDIDKWLFDRSTGKKKPMIDACKREKADYLMCRISYWQNEAEDINRFVLKLFRQVLCKDKIYHALDDKLGKQLLGIIFFEENENIRLVHNLNYFSKYHL